MEQSCSSLHITKDLVTKLEIIKIILSNYENELYDEIYDEIYTSNDSKKYLKTKPDLEQKR